MRADADVRPPVTQTALLPHAPQPHTTYVFLFGLTTALLLLLHDRLVSVGLGVRQFLSEHERITGMLRIWKRDAGEVIRTLNSH